MGARPLIGIDPQKAGHVVQQKQQIAFKIRQPSLSQRTADYKRRYDDLPIAFSMHRTRLRRAWLL
jgi:hypothetical protein